MEASQRIRASRPLATTAMHGRVDELKAQGESVIDFSIAISHFAPPPAVLEAIADGSGPAEALIALGHAGWGPGQLEEEMADNSWLSTPVDADILFDLPFAARWQAAARRIGVDLSLISPDAGHA